MISRKMRVNAFLTSGNLMSIKSFFRPISILMMALSVSYLLVCFFIYADQEQYIFHPQPRSVTDNKFTTLLQSENKQIVVTSLIKDTRKALIYLGGNAEDVSLNLMSFANLMPEYSIYLLHYRGYGGSEGEPGEAAIREDIRVLYQYVAKRHDSISVVGRSLGTGFAVMLASEKPVEHLVLITPYASMAELASRNFPIFPVDLLLKHKIQAERFAPKVVAQTTVFLAEHDEVIPKGSSIRLVQSFKRRPPDVIVLNEDHNSIVHPIQLHEALRKAL